MNHFLQCVLCRKKYDYGKIRYRCECGETLEVRQSNFVHLKNKPLKELFERRLGNLGFPFVSGVWRYKELVLPVDDKYIFSKQEGNTNLYPVGISVENGLKKIGQYVSLDNFYLKHEGENPTGSFKDRGMTVGIAQAKALGVKVVACASTGNTSSSLASYAALAGLRCFVFLPKGKISSSKLAQSLAFGAFTIQIEGDFDQTMKLVTEICNEHGVYLLNSINPYRIEGQKTIAFEIMQQLHWKAPDWIVLPGGNLGNTSAIGKGLLELKEIGMINKLPKIATIQAEGANPFYLYFKSGFRKIYKVKAKTAANAIRIGNPVNLTKARKAVEETDGLVEQVNDQEILDAKAIIDICGIGCEPASATTVAGTKKLVRRRVIEKEDIVVGILTGHILKDPDITIGYHQQALIDMKGHFANKIASTTSDKIHKYITSFLKRVS